MDFRTNFVPKKNHQNSTFWPDLAPCHYSNENQEWLKENTLTFVPKLHNPPSVLQIRPIEAFWSILKQKVYSGDWSAKDHSQFFCRIKKCALEIDPDVITKMFQNLKARIHKANENGLTSLL